MFTPEVGLELAIEGKTYRVAAHPAAPWLPYGQEGRAAIVYRLEAETGEAVALKVFKERFRTPSLVGLKRKLEPFATLPGLTVCRREVLTPTRHRALLQRYPDLLYAVLMPWIEGPTWQEIVQTRQALTCEQSLALAQSLLNVLVGMEEEGIAHCDLSGPNLLLPALAGGEGVELVDVEGIYAPGLRRPKLILSGTEGYAHREAREGAWHQAADRFAGAVLLAEILGWCDERVREAAWGESYFAPEEVQRESERYRLLQQVLKARWGESMAHHFARAWQSEALEEAPPFGAWMVGLPDRPASRQVPSPESESAPPAPEGSEGTVKVLLDLGEQFEAQGARESAAQVYRQAVALMSAEDARREDLLRRIRQLTQAEEEAAREEEAESAEPWMAEEMEYEGKTTSYPRARLKRIHWAWGGFYLLLGAALWKLPFPYYSYFLALPLLFLSVVIPIVRIDRTIISNILKGNYIFWWRVYLLLVVGGLLISLLNMLLWSSNFIFIALLLFHFIIAPLVTIWVAIKYPIQWQYAIVAISAYYITELPFTCLYYNDLYVDTPLWVWTFANIGAVSIISIQRQETLQDR